MICKLFIFRHAETTDNSNGIFSGWRDSELTARGILQAQKIAKQLSGCRIDYAFSSHLKRARHTLRIVLAEHPLTPVFIDDRLIERSYGLFQGRHKKNIQQEDPEFYESFHRCYLTAPPEGESLEMVEKRVLSFLEQLKEWLKQNPGNVAISCHNNSIRPFRRISEKLSIPEMCKLESPQDKAIVYTLDLGYVTQLSPNRKAAKTGWIGVQNSKQVKLATDPQNLLKTYY
jgi:broad specificity phosphatase PhoE